MSVPYDRTYVVVSGRFENDHELDCIKDAAVLHDKRGNLNFGHVIVVKEVTFAVVP